MASTKKYSKGIPEGFYDHIQNDVLRSYLIKNNYGTQVDLEDEENKDLTVRLTVIDISKEVNDDPYYCEVDLSD